MQSLIEYKSNFGMPSIDDLAAQLYIPSQHELDQCKALQKLLQASCPYNPVSVIATRRGPQVFVDYPVVFSCHR